MIEQLSKITDKNLFTNFFMVYITLAIVKFQGCFIFLYCNVVKKMFLFFYSKYLCTEIIDKIKCFVKKSPFEKLFGLGPLEKLRVDFAQLRN